MSISKKLKRNADYHILPFTKKMNVIELSDFIDAISTTSEFNDKGWNESKQNMFAGFLLSIVDTHKRTFHEWMKALENFVETKYP